MTDKPFVAIAVNRQKQFFLLEDDTILPFACMLDSLGEETDNPSECIVAIFQLPNGRWSGIHLSEFEETLTQ